MSFGITKNNRNILDLLNRTLEGPFTIEDASRKLSIPKERSGIILAYFTRKGWLSRIKTGLYITVPLGTVNPAEHKENTWVVADHVFKPCYIGGWSAAEYWEFTDQIFSTIVVFTLRKFRNRKKSIQGTEYLIKQRNPRFFGKTKSIWIENRKILISDPVQTIVDILDDPTVGGGIRNGSEIVREYFESKHRDDKTIIDYIRTGRNRTVYKRLGYIIETLGIRAPVLMDECKSNISSGFSLLDPAVISKGSTYSKWKLIINSDIKT